MSIMTSEDSNEATIFLYGYIGEEWEFNGSDWTIGGNTDTEFVQELLRLEAKYSLINVRINSYGGDMMHGNAIISAMKRSKAEIHTYNDGIAASMAGAIWLCGQKRHMATNAMLMLHAGSNIVWGNAQDMREMADVLDQFTKTMVISISENTGQSEEEINKKFFSDYKDHFLTYSDVAAEPGFLTEKADNYTGEGLQLPAASMNSYRDMVLYLQEKNKPTQSFLQQIRAAFAEVVAAIKPGEQPVIHSPTNINDMKFDDFKTSLADGSLKIEEVQAHLSTIAPPTAATDPEETEEEETAPEVNAQIQQLNDLVKDLTQKVEAFGAMQAASKSQPGLPSGDPPTGDDSRVSALNDFNTTVAAAAKEETNPFQRRG